MFMNQIKQCHLILFLLHYGTIDFVYLKCTFIPFPNPMRHNTVVSEIFLFFFYIKTVLYVYIHLVDLIVIVQNPNNVKKKFCPMLGTHGQWAVRVLYRATPTVTLGIHLFGYLRGHVTLTPIAERLTMELSPPVFTT